MSPTRFPKRARPTGDRTDTPPPPSGSPAPTILYSRHSSSARFLTATGAKLDRVGGLPNFDVSSGERSADAVNNDLLCGDLVNWNIHAEPAPEAVKLPGGELAVGE